ncbi:MAG: hypothetical protein M9892_05635 [Bacteroidetes bacterium]|nr:hypothetical protein [Bacteroidota bacterium]
MSCTDTLNPLVDWEYNVEPVWKLNNSYFSANIGLLFFDYDRVKPHALDSGLLISDGQYLYDPVPAIGNPFEKQELMAYFPCIDFAFFLQEKRTF